MAFTPQDTFDALRNEIPEKELIEMLVGIAMQKLHDDDANPDVGWGLMQSHAINLAIKDVQKAATIWRRNVFISDGIVKKVSVIVEKKRDNR